MQTAQLEKIKVISFLSKWQPNKFFSPCTRIAGIEVYRDSSLGILSRRGEVSFLEESPAQTSSRAILWFVHEWTRSAELSLFQVRVSQLTKPTTAPSFPAIEPRCGAAATFRHTTNSYTLPVLESSELKENKVVYCEREQTSKNSHCILRVTRLESVRNTAF